MLKEGQYFTVKWCGKNIKHYESLGYKFTHAYDEFVVPLEHLPRRTARKVVAICDFCGKEYLVSLDNYNGNKRESDLVACKQCHNLNVHKTIKDKYGVNAPLQVVEFKEKTKNTVREKYGVDNVVQSKEVQEKHQATINERYGETYVGAVDSIIQKRKETNLEKYGVENPIGLSEFREKSQNTMLEKYGVDNPTKSQYFIDKMKATNIERYGGESSQCSLEVRKKSYDTLMQNGTLPSSKAERETVNIITEIYGKENVIPQYFFDHLSFDCLLIVDNVKIDVEYDGRYWHDKERDKRRDFFTMRRGIKVLRFVSDNNIPTKEQIVQAVDYLVNTEHKHYIIEI